MTPASSRRASTTDILVFRKLDSQPSANAETFINTRPIETGKMVDGSTETVDINEYFHRHPETMLGACDAGYRQKTPILS